MSREARAIIRWVPASRGGRQSPPETPVGYSAPARFECDPREESGAWSLKIVQSSSLRDAEVIDARIAFLAPEAPHRFLNEGERFELLEGNRVVAKGICVSDDIPVPTQINEFELALLG